MADAGPGGRLKLAVDRAATMRLEHRLRTIDASRFSVEELAAIYNETRSDYIVPMPMSPARLAEYMTVYDVSRTASSVIVDDIGPVGLGMLGLRPGQAWITRLGVSPRRRQAGAGSMLMETLISAASLSGARTVWLEVIKGNQAAFRLFQRYGFSETRELLVIRRSPVARQQGWPAVAEMIDAVNPLTRDEALALLEARAERPNWLNETSSMRNSGQLEALMVHCHDGGRGWASFDVGKFQLTRVVVEVMDGDPVAVSAAVLHAVHQNHPRKDTFIENVAADDPKWPGFQQMGYFDAFRRLEMVRLLEQ